MHTWISGNKTMSANWAEKLTRWRPHESEDRVYDLSHVHPFRYSLTLAAMPNHPAREVEVRVGFSAHTFTVGCQPPEVAHPHYSRPQDPRKFCPVRYELSRQLPDIMRNLEQRKCFFTNYKNYFVVEMPDALPRGLEYWVFFDVRHAGERGAVLIFVESAYAGDATKTPYRSRREKVGFKVLVNKALQGERPKPPP